MRNAFFMLYFYRRERAVAYLLANVLATMAWAPGTVQMVAITLTHRACSCGLSNKKRNRFVKIIMSILSTCSTCDAVIYEAAGALLSLCSKPVAARAAADACYRLLCSSSDKEVESTVLDRTALTSCASRIVMS
ncbi:unnamed protein product [Urochloa humidicola]